MENRALSLCLRRPSAHGDLQCFPPRVFSTRSMKSPLSALQRMVIRRSPAPPAALDGVVQSVAQQGAQIHIRHRQVPGRRRRSLRRLPNLDTDLLKLIAIAAMLIDHIGGAFSRRWACSAGSADWRFPIFCYCLTVGLLYTHDVRKYLTRLGIFACQPAL